MSDIDVTYTDRGFSRYGDAFDTDYGHTVQVYESSSAMQHSVWMRIDSAKVDESFRNHTGMGNATVHMTKSQARKLRDRLNVFLNEQTPRVFLGGKDD